MSDTGPLPGTTLDPNLPDSGELVMAESDYHTCAVIGLRQALADHFNDSPDVYVASNLSLYYETGGLRNRYAPDVMVVRGVGKYPRRSFRVWEEGAIPATVFEVVSALTCGVDRFEKARQYSRLGVREYFLFDPEGRLLTPSLQGFRLYRRNYVPILCADDGVLMSRELGLCLLAEGPTLRLIDDATGDPVPTRQERTNALSAEVERLRGLLEGGPGPSGNRK